MGYKHHKPIQQFIDNNAALDRKLKSICFDLKPAVQYLLFALSNQDKELVADFILAWQEQQGRGRPMATLTKRSYIITLVYLSRYCNGKPFRDMTREDIIDGIWHACVHLPKMTQMRDG